MFIAQWRTVFQGQHWTVEPMSIPRAGDSVNVTLKNGETVEGIIEWIDGNGAWVKGPKKARWIPIEALLFTPVASEAKPGTGPEE